MQGCACKREHLKRRSMARWLRASSSISASHSSVAVTLRFLVAASEIVVSSWRLIVDRLSWSSFSGSVLTFLAESKNEGIVGQQRHPGESLPCSQVSHCSRHPAVSRHSPG